MKASRVLFFLLLLFCLPLACSSKDGAKTKTKPKNTKKSSEKKDEPKKTNVSPDTVIAMGRDITVTVGDFDRHFRRGILYAPDSILKKGQLSVSTERLSDPYLHMNVTSILMAQQIAEAEAKKRGVRVTPEEITQKIKEDKRLSRFTSDHITLANGTQLPISLKDLKLERSDLETLARNMIVREKLAALLIEEISPEQAWESYRTMNDTIDLIVLAWDNTPLSEEIDEFVRDPGHFKTIKTFFENNKRRYRIPGMVELTLLKTPGKNPPPDWKQTLEKAQKRLEKGEDAETVAKDLGLKYRAKESLVRQEDSRAFRGKVGDVGISYKKPRGSYVWKVTGMKKSREPELDRPLRREVAAELLRTTMLAPSLKKIFSQVQPLLTKLPAKQSPEKMMASLQKSIKNKRVKAYHTGHFIRDRSGYIPKIGLAKPVLDTAFARPDDKPVSPQPIQSEQSVFAFRVIERKTPNRAEFDKNKDTILASYKQSQRPHHLDRMLNRWRKSYEVKLELKPLRQKYGVAKKRPRRRP